MGKMKQVAMDAAQRDQGMQTDKFLDDEIQCMDFIEMQIMNKILPLSKCCEAKVSFSSELNENICTQCHEICQII